MVLVASPTVVVSCLHKVVNVLTRIQTTDFLVIASIPSSGGWVCLQHEVDPNYEILSPKIHRKCHQQLLQDMGRKSNYANTFVFSIQNRVWS